MKEVEKNVLCALLQALLDKNLITRNSCEKAKTRVLDTFDSPVFFYYCEDEEVADGYTQNSC